VLLEEMVGIYINMYISYDRGAMDLLIYEREALGPSCLYSRKCDNIQVPVSHVCLCHASYCTVVSAISRCS